MIEDDYSISPTTAKKVARQDAGDTLFDPVDGGSDCPPELNQLADARNAGMLLSRALIREQIAVPASGAQQRHVPSPIHNPADPFAGRRIVGTCSGCHNTPNVGNHSRSLMLNTSVANALPRDNGGRPMTGVPDIDSLPVYTLQSAGAVVRVTDTARALITGRWTNSACVLSTSRRRW